MNLSLSTTIIFLLLGLGYLFTLVLIFAYEYKHIKNLKTNTFFLAKCAQAIAWFFLIFRGGNFEYIGIVIANSLLFISYTFEIIAFLELKQTLHKKTKIRYLIFTILSIIGFHIIFIFYNKESIRIAYYAFVNAAIYLSVYRIAFGKTHTLLMRIMGIMYILFAIGSLSRGIISLITYSSSTSLFTSGPYQLILVLAIFIFSNFGCIGFILLKKEKVDKELMYFATYDDLTGTLNRRIFTENTKQYLSTYAKKGQCISYILFDIDNFKGINDTFGHHIGDEILKDLTSKIKDQLDNEDLFGRYGGDEFGILLPGKNVAESTKVAEQIKQSLHDNMNHRLPVTYTISMGIITIIPEQSTRLEVLYKNCDKALYKAKENGRNGIFRGQLEDNPEIL